MVIVGAAVNVNVNLIVIVIVLKHSCGSMRERKVEGRKGKDGGTACVTGAASSAFQLKK